MKRHCGIVIALLCGAGYMSYSSKAEAADDVAKVRIKLQVPAEQKDPEIAAFVARAEQSASIPASGSFDSVVQHPTVVKSDEKSRTPQAVDVKLTYKAGKLTSFSGRERNGRGFEVSYRGDGTVSAYKEGTLKPLTGMAVWFGPNGRPTTLTTMSNAMLLGKQITWNDAGDVTKFEDVKEPRKIELIAPPQTQP